MGHTRIGTLPDTARWRKVVGLLADEADVPAVATATTEAALHGLKKARHDEGLAYSVWLLTQLVGAARLNDFVVALHAAGLAVPDQPGVFDLAAAFSEAVDRHLRLTHRRTDIGEMAEMAAVEALSSQLGERAASLFGTAPDDVRRAAQALSTEQGFATLAHDFFARFAQRFLTYHLGRELSRHVGGNGRFAGPDEHTEFVAQLAVHCREAAAIMRDYAAGWFSKANSEGGVTLDKARDFADYVVTKLRKELRLRGERDGQ